MGRGPTAYFLFSDENRASAKAELEAAGSKLGVAQVAKLVGQRWGALSDEEKQKYKERAAALQVEAAAAAAEATAEQQQQSPGGDGAAGDDAAAGGGKAAPPPPPFGLPTGSVKRIITLDSEVQRVSADAVRAIAKAAELFVGALAVKSMEHAAADKRKNFKFADVEHVAGRDRRLQDMGLREVLHNQAAAPAGGGGANENGGDGAGGDAPGETAKKQTKRQKKDEAAAANTRSIASFFAAAPAAAAAAAAEPSAVEA
ncbi:Tryptophan-tRNA ligase [Micractinium conductrix]|uniref:Tryptophan-tRNA ligase n=1 Tax=Micractinium conductrix TaxID=554055 RepID=A0A2P6VRR1_9CHLO|nr:Tryptophan-tRNA ligase [Micractinium conductrix]|eukprot:PSC76788.1 Tryptophan-tRNA ligase [Micractinium conductrix]